MHRRTFTLAGAALGALSLAPAAAFAQAGKPIRILVGFPPGQATDAVARMLAERLTATLAQPVIVENKPGQGGSVVIAQLAKSPPDGSVVTLSALAAYSVNPHLYKNVGYDTLKDLDPIGSVADLPLALVVHPSLPVRSVAELVAHAKANPDKLSHPSSGNGTLSHLMMEDFKRRAGIRLLHVPYQGSAKAMTDLVAGNVQVGLDTLAVTLPLVQGTKLRMLAVGTSKRVSTLPDVPTIAESGFSGFEAVAWIGMSAPAGTPLEWRERINREIQAVVKSPEFEHRLAALGSFPRPGSVTDFGNLLKSEYARWSTVVQQSGAKVD